MQSIATVEQLLDLRHRFRSVFLLRQAADYRFELPMLTETVNRNISLRFNGYKNECGCFTGGLLMGLCAVFLLPYVLLSSIPIADLGWRHLGLSVLGLIACMFIGKALGILFGRLRMVRTLNDAIAQVGSGPM